MSEPDTTGLAGDWRYWLLVIFFTLPVSIWFLMAIGIHSSTTRLDRHRRLPNPAHWLLAVGAVAVVLVALGWAFAVR